MRAYERLLKYVAIPTQSDEASEKTPSTACQFDLAQALAGEMKALGIADVCVDEKCYVTGTIPASQGLEACPAIAFIAHLDTAPAFSGENVRPQIIADYDGKAVKLGESGRLLDPEMFPHLPSLAGRTLITTDGTTLLGADDKAGVAEIMTMAEEVISSGIPHGRICIAFTPDEEIGSGAAGLDLEKFGADYGYTVDGGAENEIEFENFNAAAAEVHFRGRSVHPGEAYHKMINALLTAMEFNSMLPACDIPALTRGYEGFFHLEEASGDAAEARLSYIVRDHSSSFFTERKAMLERIAQCLNDKYGEGTVSLTIRDQYRNMREIMESCMHLVENAQEAIRKAGAEPCTAPIRGGTDGAQLSFRGLPCPNLGTGGYAFHGPFEHITAEGMDFAVKVLRGLVERYGKA